MRYGKLVDGEFISAPKFVKVGDRVVFNPGSDILEEKGYQPVLYTDAPKVENGYYVESYWIEDERGIVQAWRSRVLEKENSIPVWDVWQGKHFNEGDKCIIEGRVFRAKVSHDAAWNKRPLTGISWKDYFEEEI